MLGCSVFHLCLSMVNDFMWQVADQVQNWPFHSAFAVTLRLAEPS